MADAAVCQKRLFYTEQEVVAATADYGADEPSSVTPSTMQEQEMQTFPVSGQNIQFQQGTVVFRNLFDTFNCPWEEI